MIAATTLWELIERRAAETPDALFAVDENDLETTFAEYRSAVEVAPAGLLSLDVTVGTNVSWTLPTRLSAMVLSGALSRLGAIQNPILPVYREREVGFVTAQTGARWLFVPEKHRGFDFVAMANAIASDRDGLTVHAVGDSLPGGDPATLPPPPAGGDVRWIYYTSGTTADPKGARHTDATLLAAAAGLVSANIVVEAFGVDCIDALARHGVTQAGAGTYFHQTYLSEQRKREAGQLFPNVRAFPGGGAPKPPELHRDIKREMGGAGIVSGYGLTECPAVTMNCVNDPDDKLAHTEGRACPPTAEVRVVTLAGEPASPGETGEVRVKGPQLFLGYVDESLNEDAFDEQRFFRTGDLGALDADGFLTITGRLKDIIIRKGENISAKEIEDLLHAHDGIADVAVIGLPDEDCGERCCAVVVPANASTPIRFDEMVAYLADTGLMRQKIPEQLELVGALPRNPTGKIEKRTLRDRFGRP